jgi:hypothetical protein
MHANCHCRTLAFAYLGAHFSHRLRIPELVLLRGPRAARISFEKRLQLLLLYVLQHVHFAVRRSSCCCARCCARCGCSCWHLHHRAAQGGCRIGIVHHLGLVIVVLPGT